MTLEQMQTEGQTLLKPTVMKNQWSREHPHHAKVAQDIMDAMWEAQIKDLDQHTADTWKAAYEAGHADALRTIPVFESNNLK